MLSSDSRAMGRLLCRMVIIKRYIGVEVGIIPNGIFGRQFAVCFYAFLRMRTRGSAPGLQRRVNLPLSLTVGYEIRPIVGPTI